MRSGPARPEAAGSLATRKGPEEAARAPPPPLAGAGSRRCAAVTAGGHEQQLSGHGGPSCTCCPTEDGEAVGAVTVSLRSRAAGSLS